MQLHRRGGIDDGSCMFPGDECEEGKGLIDEFCECIVGEGSGGDGHEEMAPALVRAKPRAFHPSEPDKWQVSCLFEPGFWVGEGVCHGRTVVFELPSTNLTEGVSLDMRLASGMYVLEVAGANQRLKERAVIRR